MDTEKGMMCLLGYSPTQRWDGLDDLVLLQMPVEQ